MILHKKDNFLVKKGLPQCVTCLRNFTNSIFQEFYNFIGNRSSDFTVNNVGQRAGFLGKTCMCRMAHMNPDIWNMFIRESHV